MARSRAVALSTRRHNQKRRDDAALSIRCANHEPLYSQMANFLTKYKETQLVIEAAEFTDLQLKQGIDIPPLDRIARRKRDGLICWFCEYHSDVLATGRFVADMHLLERTTHRPTRQPMGTRQRAGAVTPGAADTDGSPFQDRSDAFSDSDGESDLNP
jgi:hypothetical protein